MRLCKVVHRPPATCRESVRLMSRAQPIASRTAAAPPLALDSAAQSGKSRESHALLVPLVVSRTVKFHLQHPSTTITETPISFACLISSLCTVGPFIWGRQHRGIPKSPSRAAEKTLEAGLWGWGSRSTSSTDPRPATSLHAPHPER